MHQVEGVNHRRRHRDGTKDPPPPLLQAFENDRLRFDVDAPRVQLQGFGDPAAGVGQHKAKRAHDARRLLGGGKKRPPLLRGQVLATALRVVELHALGVVAVVTHAAAR